MPLRSFEDPRFGVGLLSTAPLVQLENISEFLLILRCHKSHKTERFSETLGSIAWVQQLKVRQDFLFLLGLVSHIAWMPQVSGICVAPDAHLVMVES